MKTHNTTCEHCGADLQKNASIEVQLVIVNKALTFSSNVDNRGKLQDVSNLVENGFHAGSYCHACGNLLEEMAESISTVNVIQIRDEVVILLKSYPDTFEGNRTAERKFCDIVKNWMIIENDCLQDHLNAGSCQIGENEMVLIVHST